MAKLPLTQTQGTGGGHNHTHSGTTCNLSYSWTSDPKTHSHPPGQKHKQDDREKKKCGGKLHDRKPPACDNDDATAGHCPKSLKSL